jgi:hypothetical protein
VLVVLLLAYVTEPQLVTELVVQLVPRFHFEAPAFVWASSERGWSTARAPPLHSALARWFP